MNWFNVRNVNAENKSAELMISGKIGKSLWDDDTVAANDFIRTVNALGEVETIDILLNSPGGSVNDGIAIYNYLKRHKATVNIEVLAEASSIASVILQAADIRSVPSNALIMVHDPMAPLMGMFNADELRAMAGRLDIVRDSILPSYSENNTGNQSSEDIQAIMKGDGTYMTGTQAVELGFADNLLEENKDAACNDKEALNVMFNDMATASADKLKANMPPPPEKPINLHEIALTACNKAGFSALAADIVSRCKDEAQITAQITMATEIQNICVASEMADDAPAILAHLGDPVAMMKETITLCQANNEDQEIELPDDKLKSQGKALNYNNIYEKRNSKNN